MNVIKLKKSLIGFLKTRLRKEPLIRAGIVSVFSVSTACGVVWLNRYNYFAGTLYRTQTVDFNILSNLLPQRLSTYLSKVPLSIADINGLQQTLDSNYGLFGIVVTDCKSIENQCPNQNIIYASKSKVEHISSGRQRLITQNRSAQKWTKKFENKDLSDRLLISSPFVILRDPPPLHQEWGFETPSNDKKILYNKQNKGRVIGRAYLIRADVPNISNELNSLKLAYTSVAISALITGLLTLLSIEFSYYLIKQAESKEAIAVQAQEQAEESARLANQNSIRANQEKEQAEESARLANENSVRANQEKEQAEKATRNIQTLSSQEIKEFMEVARLANENSVRANQEKEQAEKVARLANENSIQANQEKEQAEKVARLANENSIQANQEKEQAEKVARLANGERDSAKTDNNTLLSEIEIEIKKQTKRLQLRIEELEQRGKVVEAEKQLLVNSNRVFQEKIDSNIIIESGEKDFYTVERKDIIIETIQKNLINELEDSRRHHILSDIVNKNQLSGENDRIKTSILRILTGYRKSDKIKNPLIKIGFDEIPGENYLKVSWKGDNRYTFSLSKTPSGNNTGENKAHDISRKIL
jgi:hypothetical protein